MSDTPEKTRSELLNELESIQGLLDDDEIPVLQEVIESLEKHHNNALGLHEVNYELDLGNSALTAEQANSHEPAEKNTTSRAQHNTAQGENPFLPQHIRSRLRGNRAGDFATEASDLKNTARQQLIDDVINDLLPQLKATLHTKLSVLTDAQLQALNSQSD
ncbi:hypothetical protein [Gilvimarinus polysaccharolyticus]|uniref:hypothetical protein n=1 Tax=Gilvimarinus polysaccharolyticus TaxID=863921 RepID=UPI000673199F|nr:hypothetical protein [Gilvimarinus polysaccharolyticus]